MLTGDRFRFTKETISRTLDTQAVYQLEDKSGILYIGSGNLTTRLTAHLPGNSEPIPATHYRRDYKGTKEAALAAEKTGLAAYKKKFGELPPYNERLG